MQEREASIISKKQFSVFRRILNVMQLEGSLNSKEFFSKDNKFSELLRN